MLDRDNFERLHLTYLQKEAAHRYHMARHYASEPSLLSQGYARITQYEAARISKMERQTRGVE